MRKFCPSLAANYKANKKRVRAILMESLKFALNKSREDLIFFTEDEIVTLLYKICGLIAYEEIQRNTLPQGGNHITMSWR